MDVTTVVQTVLAAVLASGASAAVVAFLAKSLVTQWLTKDLERFRTQLTAEAARETEQLRAQLERVAMEHQVRFTRLHAKRSHIIATIYAELEGLHATLRNWHNVHSVLNDPAQRAAEAAEFGKRAREATARLEAFYYPRAIWLERDLCEQLNKLLMALNLLLRMLEGEAKGTPIVTQGKSDSRDLAWEVLGIATNLRTALEDRFRAILGIANAAPAGAT